MAKEEKRRPIIALTGATGLTSRSLIEKLQKNYDIIALSPSIDQQQNTEHITWRSCDFFSYADVEKALFGADYAIYFIHSMPPSAKLTQGSFEDMDAILAEHFARAAQRTGIKKIVYISSMIPPDTKEEDLSRHLRSRLEVERILGAYGTPVTTLRADLIAGPSAPSVPIKSLKSDVRSVKRICLPEGKDADWCLHYYVHWLSRITRPFIRIETSGQISRIYLLTLKKPILELTHEKERSSSRHAYYRISGGIFVNSKVAHNGRLEFLQLPNSQECIVAIHDYLPALPWFIYKYSQAKIHLWVMKAFDLHLKKLKQSTYHG